MPRTILGPILSILHVKALFDEISHGDIAVITEGKAWIETKQYEWNIYEWSMVRSQSTDIECWLNCICHFQELPW